ncbi:IclR family transcriptional regulator [Rhodoluna lacicola]|uniref:Transcriptional regulator n=1 Tax=Rhodoluna lacicola TaxID=529884 RepID=A0A060JAJ7_9MICO|nr:IclR family transcriptional regulator [Rhodoluna lacicola]AIC46906.1 Transcriptional regulator [Rhodoluna lacicola]
MAEAKPTQRRNAAGLSRDLEVLEVLGTPEALRNHGLGVNRVAELTARDKGQISRTLATLADAGFVDRDRATGKYRLGFQLYSLASRTAEARFVEEAGRFLRKVVNLTHETTHLCVLRGGNVLTLKSELSTHAFRGVGWEGVSVAALSTSSGRALLSDWNDAEIDEWYAEHAQDTLIIRPTIGASLQDEGALPQVDKSRRLGKIKNVEDLKKELALIRKVGYAKVDEEFEWGLVGASAPIRDQSNRIIGVMNVSAPKTRIGSHLDQVGEIIAKVGLEFSLYLGASKITY